MITDPLDPIVFGANGVMSVTIAAAAYQWFWVGGARTIVPGGASFVVEVFAPGFGGYGVEEYQTPSAGGLGSLRGYCVRARQAPVASTIEIEISRGMYEENGEQDIVMMIGGRTGSLW